MASQLSSLSPSMNRALVQSLASVDRLNWVFLGPPGVGKGTYASRLATALGVPHIAAGDLVRAEIKSASKLGKEMSEIVNKGQLLPDDLITQLLLARVESGALETAEQGFILDGFPRTRKQAEDLQVAVPVHLAVNLSLREDILVQKCLGRRICRKCGKNWNVADIYVPASDSHPEIVMPPLMPPKECLPRLETRADDREEVIRQRLKVHEDTARPVGEFFRELGVLLDFEITGGIPETLPRLLHVLQDHLPQRWQLPSAHQ